MQDKRKETDLQKTLAIGFSDNGRLWINDNGFGFHKIGDKYIGFRYGLGVGIADLIGYTEVVITEDMVGRRLPIFTAFEVKTSSGRPSVEQEKFIAFIKSKGGIGAIVRSRDDIDKEINEWHTK